MMTHAKMGHQRDGGALNINALQLLVFLCKLLYSSFKSKRVFKEPWFCSIISDFIILSFCGLVEFI